MEFKKTLKSFLEANQYLPGIDTEDSNGRYPTEAKFLEADHEQILRWHRFLPAPTDPQQKKVKALIDARIKQGDKAGKLNSILDTTTKVESPNTNESKKTK